MPRCAAARGASTAASRRRRGARTSATRDRYVVDACVRGRARRDRAAGRAATGRRRRPTTTSATRTPARRGRRAGAAGRRARRRASGCASTARSTSMRAVRASAERSIAASRSGLAARVVPPAIQAVSRILQPCRGSVSLPRSSTSSSATSTATSTASSRPTSGPSRRVRPRRVPRALGHRLPARGPPAAPVVRRALRRDGREVRGAHRSHRRGRRLPRGAAATSSNAAAVCANGRVQGVYRKHLLPNYAVFDEQRYFAPSTVDGPLFVIAGVRVARHDLRRRLEPERPDHHPGRGRRRVRREHQRVAVLRGPHARARDHARDACRRRVGARCST